MTETEIVSGKPQKIFGHIQHVDKHTGDATQLIPVKPEKGMTTKRGRSQRRTAEHQRIQPGQHRLRKRTGEEQVLERLDSRATKTIRRNSVTKRRQTFSGVENTVSHLPAQINDWTIHVKPVELIPSKRPVQWPVLPRKLCHTMRVRTMLGQQIGVHRLGGNTRYPSRN